MKKSRMNELKQLLKTMLTEDQLQELAAWSLITGGDRFLLDLENRLKGDELSIAASEVWKCWRSEGKVEPAPSASKLLQDWEDLRSRWVDTVESSSDMEGRYSGERNHWEPPWWDGYLLMHDLDEIAAEMKPLVKDAFEHGGEMPFLLEAIELARASLPDWVGAEYDDVPPVAPTMVEVTLQWEWLGSHDDPDRFVEKVRDLEELFCGFPVDEQGAELFLKTLAAKEREALYIALGKVDDWPFPDMYLDLAAEFDRQAWLGQSEEEIPRNWRLGVPVLEDCVQREDWEVVKMIAARMLSSSLDHREVSLKDTLLLNEVRWRGLRDDECFIGLLRSWQTGAEHTGEEVLATLLCCQCSVLMYQHDWDNLVEAFRRDVVFDLWQEWLTLLGHAHHQGKDPACNWMIALWGGVLAHDSALETTQNVLRKVAYLSDVEPLNLRSAAILTGDLLAISGEFPNLLTLCSSISKCEEYAEERRKWLARLNVSTLTETVVEFWRGRCRSLLPNPKDFTGSYGTCVRWIAALSELDSNSFHEVIGEWAAVHKRRRNLWKELQEAGLVTWGSRFRGEPAGVLWLKGGV